MVKISEELYIYNKSIKIKNHKTISEISFYNKIPDYTKTTSLNLFENIIEDNIKYLNDKTLKNKILTMKNITLPKSLSLFDLKLIIAFCLEINISEIEILYTNFETVNKKDIKKINTLKFNYQNKIYNQDFYKNISIGDSDITVIYTGNDDIKINNYEKDFFTNYITQLKYIKKLLENSKKMGLKEFNDNISVKNIEVSLIYGSTKDFSIEINLPKLFNMLHISKIYRKIIIHDSIIDAYQSNARSLQYCKSTHDTLNPFKGTISKYNCLNIYIGKEIDKSITLTRIEITKNTTINIAFTISDTFLTIDDIKTKLSDYFKENSEFWILLKKLKINEAVYDLNFDIKNYIPIYNTISASYIYTNTKADDMNNVSLLFSQEIPDIKYKTKTSILFTNYCFFDINVYNKYLYLKTIYDVITKSIIQKSILPTNHISESSDEIVVFSFDNCSTFNSLINNFLYLLPLFKYKQKKEDKKDIKLNVKNLRKKYSNIPDKELLNKLLSIDPITFGSREKNNKKKPYSGLAQKKEQRVVPISLEEYEYLNNELPESVINIKNQHNPEQRLCLFCPFKEFSTINFHYMNGQLCVPKCTTKSSNKSQYLFCSKQLDNLNLIKFENRFENKTIIHYNPLLTPGRKCKPPPEFNNVLIDYVLYKIKTTKNIVKYCLDNYKAHPFIIKRDEINSNYEILMEYNDNIDYVLVIQSEGDDMYFVFLNEHEFKPLLFSQNPEIKSFFKENSVKSSLQFNFFNFIEKIIKTNLSQYYSDYFKNIFNILISNHKIKFVIFEDFIYGIIYKNILYMTPKFYYVFEDQDLINTEQLYNAISNYKYPNISSLDKNGITKLYMDYNDKKIHAINYYNVDVLIEKTDITAKYEHIKTLLFDKSAIFNKYLNINFEKQTNLKQRELKILNIKDILNTYIFIFIHLYDNFNIDIFKKELFKLNIIQKYTDIRYTQEKTYVSWRKSKISEEDFEYFIKNNFSFSHINLIEIMYTQFQNNLEFKIINSLETLSSKIITY